MPSSFHHVSSLKYHELVEAALALRQALLILEEVAKDAEDRKWAGVIDHVVKGLRDKSYFHDVEKAAYLADNISWPYPRRPRTFYQDTLGRH